MPGDELLLQRTAAGDGSALAELYDRYAPRVFGLALKFVHKPQDAEDVLQEVFLELPRRAGSFNPSLGSAESWILMLARSRAIDRVRRLRREREHLRALEPVARADDPARLVTTHADAATLAHEHDWMRSLLDALPLDLRGVVQLAYAHGYTREQIAAALDMPTGTVKTRLRAAIHALAAHVAQRQANPSAHGHAPSSDPDTRHAEGRGQP